MWEHGTTPDIWIRMRANYDIAQAKGREDQIKVERHEPRKVVGEVGIARDRPQGGRSSCTALPATGQPTRQGRYNFSLRLQPWEAVQTTPSPGKGDTNYGQT